MQDFLAKIAACNDETRLQILAFIALYKRVCVCDIENSFGLIQSRVSRHLKILKEAGFLDVSREGRWAYFSIKEDLDPLSHDLLKHIKALKLNLPKLIHNCKV